MDSRAFYDALDAAPMVPVFCHADVETAKAVLKACYAGGVRVFEFTDRDDAAEAVFRELAPFAEKETPGLMLGAGSISSPACARRYIRAGARFVVGPQYVPAVNRICRLRGIPYIPGCGTVSEVGRAQRAGCRICKVFPGEVLGPKFVKALLAPMPWSRLMITGGVEPSEESLRAWFTAGARYVGMGSKLLPKSIVSDKDWNQLTSICQSCFDIIKQYE